MSRNVVGSSRTSVPRALRERARDAHALPLPARERVGHAIAERVDAGVDERLRDGGFVGARRSTPAPRVRQPSERDVLADGQRKRGLLALRHDGDRTRTVDRRERTHVDAADQHAPTGQRHPPEQRPHQRALAAAVRSDDRRHTPRGHVERDARERGPLRARIAHVHVLERERGRHGHAIRRHA